MQICPFSFFYDKQPINREAAIGWEYEPKTQYPWNCPTELKALGRPLRQSKYSFNDWLYLRMAMEHCENSSQCLNKLYKIAISDTDIDHPIRPQNCSLLTSLDLRLELLMLYHA